MKKLGLIMVAGLLASITWHPLEAGTVLTFDHNPLVNFERIDQAYGDRVTISPDARGHQYQAIDDGFGSTPNVTVEYGGSLPSLWTTGYGDLVNILFNDQDGDTTLNLTLTADPGFEVGLFGFDLASFGFGQAVQGIDIRDGAAGSVLFSRDFTFVDGATHVDIDFAGGLFASSIILDIDLSGLGTLSDNIGIDNVYFAQIEVNPVPAPAALWLFASGIIGLIGFGNRKK